MTLTRRYNLARLSLIPQSKSQQAAHLAIDNILKRAAHDLDMLLSQSQEKHDTLLALENLARYAHKAVALEGMPMYTGLAKDATE